MSLKRGVMLVVLFLVVMSAFVVADWTKYTALESDVGQAFWRVL